MPLIKIKNVHLLADKEWLTREVRKHARTIDLTDGNSADMLLAQNMGMTPGVRVVEAPP